MDWDDHWWQILIGAFLILLGVGLIVNTLKRCCGGKKKKPIEVLVLPVSTIQGAYVPSPQYNSAYEYQNVHQNNENDSSGWNVTDINQQQPPKTDTILMLPIAPIGFPAPSTPYEKPPPYNPNP